jgi:DNA gyrase subunit A
MAEIGKLQKTEIVTEMKKAYLDYAMSVIVQRALPDVRDGLKPVHRRILFAMNEIGLTHSAKYKKSATVVGDVLGKYHPHGDVPVYDAMVRLAQDFALRYPLIDGQGNFGSIDGDPPAAMRYTEARMAGITEEMLTDIDKETVDFFDNFDASRKEPVYLPAKLPNLLLMGSEGIAVGMATKIPPHNLGEVIDAIVFMIGKAKFDKNKTEVKPIEKETGERAAVADAALTEESEVALSSDASIDELTEFIKGPDFPTGGSIYDITEIRNVYATGRGKILIRGKADIEEIGNGKSAIIITELPYQVNKAMLVARIADLAKEKKIEGITDLRDESDRHGIRVVVELKRDAVPKKVLNNLFKNTSLQTSFPANVVALVNGVPQTLNLKSILEEYLKHRYIVIRRRTEFELKQAKARLHILEGLKIAVDNLDAVIKTIRESKTQDEAKQNLMDRFKLSEIQATAILDLQLRRLAALERQKIEDEYKMVKETIAYLEDLLAHPAKILTIVKDELTKLKEKYADARRTKVYKGKVGEFSDEDLIPNEPTVITITNTGYIKRQSLSSFRTQNRGGKGIKGMTTKEEDGILHIRYAQTHDNLLFFTNKGKVYQLRAFEISESQRTSKGTAVVNLINTEAGEKVEAFINYPVGKEAKIDKKFIFLTTKHGTVKKTKLTEFENIRRSGIAAIKLDKSDELVASKLTDGDGDVILTTKEGKAIRFAEAEVRPIGRSAQGVRGIKIATTDTVIGMDIIGKNEKLDLLTIMENGLGKKTSVELFRGQSRGGQGVKVAKVTDKTGKVAFSQVIPPSEKEVIITSKRGQIVKLEIASIPRLSRDTQGVILMRFSNASDKVASATTIVEEES